MTTARTRILIVDDQPDVAEMLSLWFRRNHFDATAVHSAAEALDAARAEHFDIIISDIGMPGMNGYELARSLRATAEYRETPMIAATGFSMYDDKERSMRAGFNHHITKPLNPVTLLALLKQIRDRL
jgi:CheY-like chemotaxis protein